tara:strand:- start:137 stop:313 length:177 start_codon:yes stop_codon:yes gene_type:complete
MPTQAQRNKTREKYQATHPKQTAKQQNTKAKMNRTGRTNKPANRDNQQKPVGTTDLAK